MKSAYKSYTKPEITKEILDKIKVGDLVKVNEWKQPLRVRGVSENYFVVARNFFGKIVYSVFSKVPFSGLRYNGKVQGDYFCGPDSWLFGDIDFDYKFDNFESIQKYLNKFETGEAEISMRKSVAVESIQIKH